MNGLTSSLLSESIECMPITQVPSQQSRCKKHALRRGDVHSSIGNATQREKR
ncbi:hypothetical protein CDEST_09636 [Colletotrichum destructivum]|uniref:Uncharacterized protein n=1 Tax=Colletotrichum destructivum TaxID=34406 RepID=A0AAX4IN68_9PEZI|nr:hypothetical protein CDEST_09636 [Colletotrichum destructivum]